MPTNAPDTEVIQFASKGNDPALPNKQDIVVLAKTIDTSSTSLKILGHGTDYGIPLQENLLHLLENYAGSIPPPNPTVGQLWFCTAVGGTGSLFYFDTSLSWVEVGSATVGPTTAGVFKSAIEPVTATDGDLWYNTTEQILYMRSTSELGPGKYAHYFGNRWVQVWPGSQVHAGLKEYNTLAARINKVIGSFLAETPQSSGGYGYGYSSGYSSGYGYGYGYGYGSGVAYWGWGQTDLLPIFTDASTPQPFDNEAWVNLIARLRKALRHVSSAGQNGFTEADVGNVGMINDGRGPTALSALWSPQTTFAYGFDDNGPATIMDYWARINSGVTFLEMMRWNLSWDDNDMATQAFLTTLPFNTQKTLQIEMKFTSETEAQYFFNRGSYINFGFNLYNFTSPLSTLWGYMLSDSQLNISGVTFEANSVRHQNDQQYAMWPANTPSPGFYQAQTYELPIYQIARLDTSPYYSFTQTIQSGIAMTVKKQFNNDGTFSLIFLIRLYENNTNYMVDGTLEIDVNVNTPRLAGSWDGNPYINSPQQILPTISSTWNLI